MNMLLSKINRPALKPALALSLLLPMLAACGEVTSADATPKPEDVNIVLPVEPELPDPAATPDVIGEADPVCRANLAEPFVGQTLDLNTRTELLAAVAPQAITRFVTPDDETEGTPPESATDANPDRLNIRTDADDQIIEVYCG